MQISPGNALNSAIIRFMFIATCFTACKIFRHKAVSFTDSLHTETVDTRIETKSLNTHSSTALISQFQSGETRWQAEIIPEGRFIYSNENGFLGTAALVRLHGTEKHASLRRDSVQNLEKSAFQQTTASTSRTRDKAATRAKINAQEKWSGYRWMWIVAALLIVAGFGWRFTFPSLRR